MSASAPEAITRASHACRSVTGQCSPETITIYRNGRSAFTSLANTGIPAAPTALGTYAVYLRDLDGHNVEAVYHGTSS